MRVCVQVCPRRPLLLGLIGVYVWVTLSESKDRPVYIVRDVVRGEPHAVHDVELTLREYSGQNGIQQILKSPTL